MESVPTVQALALGFLVGVGLLSKLIPAFHFPFTAEFGGAGEVSWSCRASVGIPTLSHIRWRNRAEECRQHNINLEPL